LANTQKASARQTIDAVKLLLTIAEPSILIILRPYQIEFKWKSGFLKLEGLHFVNPEVSVSVVSLDLKFLASLKLSSPDAMIEIQRVDNGLRFSLEGFTTSIEACDSVSPAGPASAT
jgi:hypothetical protein